MSGIFSITFVYTLEKPLKIQKEQQKLREKKLVVNEQSLYRFIDLVTIL